VEEIFNIIVLGKIKPHEAPNFSNFNNVDIDKKLAGLILIIAFGKATIRN